MMRTPGHTLRAAAASLLMGAVVGLTSTAARGDIDARFDPKHVTAPPLHAIAKISPQRLTLKNGIIVYLLEDHTLPVVRGMAYVKASPTWIPNDKVGLGGMTGQVMRSGGTAAHPGDALDDRLASIGASISTSFDGQELASSDFRCLTDNLAEVLGLWAEVMRKPAFPEDKIELAKVGMRRDIASRNDEMIPLLVRVARQAAYGKNSIWARQPEYTTVEAIRREDMVELHKKLFEPSRMVVAVYGDFKAADLQKRLETALGDWKGARVPLPAQPPVANEGPARIVFAPKEDVTQSGIILCRIGFRADDPDYPAMDVYQTALGGGFQSRLVNKIRTERGLAYATGATAGEGYQKPGVFFAYSLTKSESTMTALELVRQEVQRSVAEPFTDEEIRTAKSTVENTFVFNFEQSSDVLFRSAYYEVVGYPQDFLQKYQQGLQQVTSASVTAAARRKVEPGKLIAVIVGKEADFDRKLESAGLPVERVDITIPPPPSKTMKGDAGLSTSDVQLASYSGEGDAASGGDASSVSDKTHDGAEPKTEPTGKSLELGRQWLKKASDLAGGAKAWGGVKSLKVFQDATILKNGHKIRASTTTTWVPPNKLLTIHKVQLGESSQSYETMTCFDGTNGWRSFGTQVNDDARLPEFVARDYQHSLFRLLGKPSEVQLQAEDAPRTVDGVSYRVGHVKNSTVDGLTLFFKPDGWLGRIEYVDEGPDGPSRQTEILDDWRTVEKGPLRYPYSRKVNVDGAPYLEAKVSLVWLDRPVDESTFKKPGS